MKKEVLLKKVEEVLHDKDCDADMKMMLILALLKAGNKRIKKEER